MGPARLRPVSGPACPVCKGKGVVERERYIAYITTGADVPHFAYCDDCDAGEAAERAGLLDDPSFDPERHGRVQ